MIQALKIIGLVLLFIISMGCKQTARQSNSSINESIVLINLGNVDRVSIGKAISAVALCKPKVIGVNARFRKIDLASSDSILVNAVGVAGNVILQSMIRADTILTSGEPMLAASANVGLLDWRLDEDQFLTHYKPFKSVENRLHWSFPMTLLSYFDPICGASLIQTIPSNEYSEIEFRYYKENFKVLEIDDVSVARCEYFRDKIVIFGFLGPGSEDSVKIAVRGSDQNEYITVVIANIVASLLADSCLNQ